MPTALELFDAVSARTFRVLPTGLPHLDGLLSGGLAPGEMLELCGAATSGKSHVGLAAAVAGESSLVRLSTLLISLNSEFQA